jgi:predicted HicB family RNase H-like nuclease
MSRFKQYPSMGIRIDKSVHEAFGIIAESKGVTRSALAKTILTEYTHQQTELTAKRK